jgi:hypothetical protein
MATFADAVWRAAEPMLTCARPSARTIARPLINRTHDCCQSFPF